MVVEGKETGETEPPATGTAAPTTSRPAGSTTAPKTGTTAPGHTHSYAKADRTTPEKCACGATRGKALGHTWKNATCQAPKTCTVCGATEGGKGDHTFVDGICSVCGTSNLADPRAKLARGKEYFGLGSFSVSGNELIGNALQFDGGGDEVVCVVMERQYTTEAKDDDGNDRTLATVYQGVKYYSFGSADTPYNCTITDKEIVVKGIVYEEGGEVTMKPVLQNDGRPKGTYSTIASWLGQVFSPELADALK